MSDINALIARIESEFSAGDKRLKDLQAKKVSEYQARLERTSKLEKTFEILRDVWRPRLEALVQKFGDRVMVKPTLTPSRRDATFHFKSKLAAVTLVFSAATDADVNNIVLSYDLRIIPVFMQFDSHSVLEMPLDNIDREKVANWIDDRIVSFVKTYMTLHETEQYWKDHVVTDPIAKVEFPDFAAAAVVEHEGKKYYFIGEETRRQFEAERGMAK